MNHFFEISDLGKKRAQSGKPYLEFLRVPALSAGVYVLRAGATDQQRPHKEDEMYYVVSGRARMKVGSEDREVSAGSAIFVEANLEHRFHNIEQDLTVLVFFAPAESS
ncbi:MAG: cupin domain-containing protein [Acidobacteria bacterium]|nr:MAG: cupin domain-containing protein [Acidobacteriota bacterium]